MIAKSALGAILATLPFVWLRDGGTTAGAVLFGVIVFVILVIVDAGGALLSEERKRNERSGAPPSPVDPESVWRRQHGRDAGPDDLA
jgi:hypothetical protein